MHRRLCAALFSLFLWGFHTSTAIGQQQPDPCLQRTILVNVFNQAGEPVSNLGRENFRAEFRGKAVSIDLANFTDQPRRLVILLDGAGERATGAAWRVPLLVAEDVVKRLPVQHSLAFVLYGLRKIEVIPFSQPRVAIRQRLASLEEGEKLSRSGPYTTLGDAIQQSKVLFGSPRLGDSVFLIAYAPATSTNFRVSEVERTLLESQIRLFAFLQDVSEEARFIVSYSDLQQLAVSTGGNFATYSSLVHYSTIGNNQSLPTPERLKAALDTMFGLLLYTYSLRIRLPAATEKPQDWKVELVLARADKNQFGMHYPKKLGGCVRNPSGS